ncbi:unnamed protein product [Tilletia controversa]|uniref:General stress protein FMN-binding split barrel domain-containing protein n=3 Tax=Tilletia TaxID=13289 RepID=A0A8X7MYB8_9BASI|nr:hypothetical protein CF328_g4780 [Tilletia controversa]KAE8197841.1 hypothetical protein CF336_g1962 [Tilletia laevis]KAE8258312.1 hypothetical protein A4X03_0g4418 [Tilletia caries]KAE8198163.1 hypothetical protein CF335_g4445 [Tilletia laevis]KAE8252620.1 hypothetical protein A4X06_0g2054 [Tilletia controversa]
MTDPTVVKAKANAPSYTPQEKLEAAVDIIKDIKVAMLTSRAADGKLASRAMQPVHIDSLATVIRFFANIESGKTDDIENDSHVNLSFLDHKTSDWVSVAGKATINSDVETKKKHWSSGIQAWFDRGSEPEHTGKHDDPRAILIEIHPEEIRAFKAHGKLKFLAETAKAAVSGDAAAGGQLITITEDELNLARKIQKA